MEKFGEEQILPKLSDKELNKEISKENWIPLVKNSLNERKELINESDPNIYLTIEDAKLMKTDIKRLMKQIYLNSNETEFIDEFLKRLADADVNEPTEEQLLKRVNKLIEARNYDGAVIVLDILIEKFPENRDEYKMKMLSIYSLLEAYEMAQTLGSSIISNLNLSEEMAYNAYSAKGLAYKRSYSRAPAAQKFSLIELSLKQYLQLLRDYKNLTNDHKATVFTLIGDRFFRMMKLVKEDNKKEKYFISSVRYFNKALKIATEPGHIVDLHENISSVTLNYKRCPNWAPFFYAKTLTLIIS
jgi:hypothetical protein